MGTDLATAVRVFQESIVLKNFRVDEEGSLSGLITIKDIEKVIEFPNVRLKMSLRLL